jgi:hypothetical protein
MPTRLASGRWTSWPRRRPAHDQHSTTGSAGFWAGPRCSTSMTGASSSPLDFCATRLWAWLLSHIALVMSQRKHSTAHSSERWVAHQPSGANAPPGPAHLVGRSDVVVEAEQVCRVVGCLYLRQTCVVRSVCRLDAVLAFIAHSEEIDVDAPWRKRPHRLPHPT